MSKMQVEQRGLWEIYGTPSKAIPKNVVEDTRSLFSNPDGSTVSTGTILIKGKEVEYVMWGDDNMLPYMMRDVVQKNMILSRCHEFNYSACYGGGLRFFDIETNKRTINPEIQEFDLINNFKKLWLELCTDFKMYNFAVVTITLSNDGKKIVRINHKDTCNIRITPDRKNVVYALFENKDSVYLGKNQEGAEVIPLLDILHPYRDLLVRTGRMPMADGICRDSSQRRFALVLTFPTVGQNYYPLPAWFSILLDHWYNIYELIGEGKERKIRNATSPRYQVEIHRQFWEKACDDKGIVDLEERKAYVKRLKQEIEDFVCGNRNAGKTWITEYFVDPNGKENHMVKVINLEDGKKEGGDWADDIQEAANMLCFAEAVHPNMVGATPGKSAMNNSGSDKRELFTLKQAQEIPSRDVLIQAFQMLLAYNKLNNKIAVDCPIVQLTTLDENKDAKTVVPNTDDNNGSED